MGMVNRRNAMLGWMVWNVGKRVAKKKAKAALPGTVDDSSRPNTSAILLLVLAIAGALWFWRGGDDSFDPTS